MTDKATFTYPETAADAFDILSGDFSDETRYDAYVDLADWLIENEDEGSPLRKALEAAETPAMFRAVLATVPFGDIAEYSSGDESVYTDGLVTSWVRENTEGYGRDRPDYTEGLYLEVKLHGDYRTRNAIERAVRDATGLTFDDLDAVNRYDGYLENDTLDWVLDGDWYFYAEEYPLLMQAVKDGRVTRSYKGVLLARPLTVAEAIEADAFIASGKIREIADNLAADWQASIATHLLVTALGLDEQPELWVDSDGTWRLTFQTEDDERKAAKAKRKVAKGKKLKKITTVDYRFV